MLPGLGSAIVGSRGRGIELVGRRDGDIVSSFSTDTVVAINSGLTGGLSGAVSNGDFVLAVYATASTASRTLSITDGTNNYTIIGAQQYANDVRDINLRAAYKFVSGDTSITFGPTQDIGDEGCYAVYVLRGVDTVTPLDVAAQAATGINSFLANPPSITPITSGARIVAFGAGTPVDAAGGEFSCSNLTDFYSDTRTGTRHIVLGIGQRTDWSSGAFDPAAFTSSNGDSVDNSWAAMTIALRPA